MLFLRSDNNQDIFVHKSGIQATNSSQPSLDDGEAVEFDVYQGMTMTTFSISEHRSI